MVGRESSAALHTFALSYCSSVSFRLVCRSITRSTMALIEPAKRKHKVLTIETKIEILNRLSKGESGSSLAKIYDIGRATIFDIKNKREVLLKYASKLDSEDGAKNRKTLRKPNNTLLEDAVYSWFTQRRSLGEPVSGPLLCEKALEINTLLCGPSDFKASTGWLKNFKSRNGIKQLRSSEVKT